MQNPSGDSTTTTKSPSSSPDQPPPPPSDATQTAAADVAAATEGGRSMAGVTVTDSDARMLPSHVDLTGGGGDGSPVGGAVGEGGSSEVAVVVESGSSVASTAERRGKQKRKPSQLLDPPAGPPKCSECGKEFPSWKSAFGHMRAHPNRHYRGFFKPPAFSSPSPTRQRFREQVGGENTNTGEERQGGGVKGATSSSRGRAVFDLNQPMEEEVGVRSSSEAAERNEAPDQSSSSDAGKSAEVGKKIGFDLNELPPPEDDGEHKPS